MALIRVLILEDDEDIIDLIRSVLEPTYECFSAANGLEGMQQAMAGDPDFIICDIMMPVMDGWEFMRRLRATPGFEQMPVIFLSALSSQAQIREGYKLGAALYLTKPIDPARLRRNLELFIKDHEITSRVKKKRIEQLNAPKVDIIDAILAEARAESKTALPPRSSSPGGTGRETPVPASPTHGRAPVTSRATRAVKLRPRLLVVEDDRDTCQLINAGLADYFEIIEAGDGITAIDRAVRYTPDIFIIDGMLPRMTGYQLTLMIRKNREFYRAPIILISGKATLRDQQYAQTLGITRFLAKPFTILQISQILDEIVAKPDFTIRSNRVDFSQVYLENFQHLETHRGSLGIGQTAESGERHHLENVIQKPHK